MQCRIYFIVLSISLIFSSNLYSQSFKINASDQSLTNVLFDLEERYHIQFSFNDQIAKACKINLVGDFKTKNLLIERILQSCDLAYKIEDEVYFIFKKTVKEKTPNKNFHFSGQILDGTSAEPLPFASIAVDGNGLNADQNGRFHFNSNNPTIKVRIAHLGYFGLDTIYPANSSQQIILNPDAIGLTELVVLANPKPMSLLPNKIGVAKVNHQIASFLPGSSDHRLFNYMRLQSGVLAAGEQSQDFFIWGSYKGQTQIVFDGITLFNTSSLNEEIGTVNPLLISDVEIHKGGYQVHLGDRIGGLVQITGKRGSVDQLHSEVHLNNRTVSALVNIPIKGRVALQASFRKSLFELPNLGRKAKASTNEIQSNFGDLNLKLTGQTKKGDSYAFHFLGNNDQNESLVKNNTEEVVLNNYLQSNLAGASFQYQKKWKNNSQSHLTLAYSYLKNNSNIVLQTFDSFTETNEEVFKSNVQNTISEISLKINHQLFSNKRHTLDVGGQFIGNSSGFQSDTIATEVKENIEHLQRTEWYIKDRIHIAKGWQIEPGIKAIIPIQGRPSVQPRIQLHYQAKAPFRLFAAYGLYHQYIGEHPFINEQNHRFYFWDIYNKNQSALLSSQHTVLGGVYQKKNWTIEVDLFYKKINNLQRFTNNTSTGEVILDFGDARSMGIDFQIKKQIKKHNFGLAYSLGKTEERFKKDGDFTYQHAPQDQRFELKTVGMLNFHPFYISLNYVFGTGLQISNEDNDFIKTPNYSRFDFALMYKWSFPKISLEFGVSLLNATNHYNIKFNNFVNLENNENLFTPGIPLSPNGFFNIKF